MGVVGRGLGVAFQDVLDVRAIPLNRTASTHRRETGRTGRLPPGSTPAERRLKHGCIPRIAAPVAPVDRPDEALGALLGDDHHLDNDRLHHRALARLADSGLLLPRHFASRQRASPVAKAEVGARLGRAIACSPEHVSAWLAGDFRPSVDAWSMLAGKLALRRW
jgi:hypothetical protein